MEMPRSRPDEPDYPMECEHSLLFAVATLKGVLATLLRSERRAAEELVGGMMLPADYPLGRTFVDVLTSRARACG